MADYFPKTDKALLIWLNNFQTKFADYAPMFGFTAADVAAVHNDYLTLVWSIAEAENFRAEAKARTNYKDIFVKSPIGSAPPGLPPVTTAPPPPVVMPPGLEERLRLVVNRIKAAPAYTTTVGVDLNIVLTGAAGAISAMAATVNAAKPTLTVEVAGGVVVIKFLKSGYNGIAIETQTGTDTTWHFLTNALFSPYQDTRPAAVPGAAEVRRYRAMFLKKNEPVGQWSDIVSVAVIG